MDLKKEALEFTEQLAILYFQHRELNSLPKYMEEHVSLIGTGSDEFSRNLDETKQALSQELAQYSSSFTIARHDLSAEVLSDNLCIVYGTLMAIPENPSLSDENVRLSLVLKKTDTGMKLVHLHLSRSDRDQESGGFYVTKAARADSDSLRRAMDSHSRLLEKFVKNIPGALHQCKNGSSANNRFPPLNSYYHEV